MANPTDMSNLEAAILECTTTEAALTLEPRHQYRVLHTGRDDENNAATDTVYLSVASGVAADGDAADPEDGDNKLILASGQTVVIGPGVGLLNYASAAGDPAISITKNQPFNIVMGH